MKGQFYEHELQKTQQKGVHLVECVLERKGNKLFVKWLCSSDEDNLWIDKDQQ